MWPPEKIASIAATILIFGAVFGVSAGEAAESALQHSQVRLIAGEQVQGAWSAGLEIKLAKGWKTYWRMPGESGVPPVFDWSGSHNLGSLDVHWPAPSRFQDAGGETIGYKDRVVFPLTVHAKDPRSPIELRLKLHYAVCKDICIPAEADLSAELDGKVTSANEQALIGEFAKLVPSPDAAGPRIVRAEFIDKEGAPRLAVEMEGEALSADADIFVEGFDNAYFRAPKHTGGTDGRSVFELPIDALRDASALRGKELTLTVIAGGTRLVRAVRVE